MESEEQSEKRGQAIRDFSTLKNSTCKSALPDYEKLTLSGCTNPRRNGSAWCQKCADEYHTKDAAN